MQAVPVYQGSLLAQTSSVVITGSKLSCPIGQVLVNGYCQYGSLSNYSGGSGVGGGGYIPESEAQVAGLSSQAKAAKDLANGLELPCAYADEPSAVYVARVMNFCIGKVEAAFPGFPKTFAGAACTSYQAKASTAWALDAKCSG